MKIINNAICLVAFLTLCSASLYAGEGHEQKTVQDSMMIDSLWRTLEYHVPQNLAENPRLVIVLHGGAMTTKFMQTVTGYGFNKLADKNGNTIIAYPQADKNFWNDGRKSISNGTEKKDLSDVLFIKSIIKKMERRYTIDSKNVFVVGYFGGGNMCFKLAKSIPASFKGFAVIGANLPTYANDKYTSSNEPISLLVINDTADPINPYEDGKVVSGEGITKVEVMSTDETLSYWLKALGHTEKKPMSTLKKVNIIEKSNSRAIRHDYFSKEENKRISLLKIVNSGYPFPNSNFDEWQQMAGNDNKYINIPEIVVTFFNHL